MAKQRNAVESCWEGFEAFKAFKGCWKRARWQFQSPIETGCGASEVPDSSFEGQQKQPRGALGGLMAKQRNAVETG